MRMSTGKLCSSQGVFDLLFRPLSQLLPQQHDRGIGVFELLLPVLQCTLCASDRVLLERERAPYLGGSLPGPRLPGLRHGRARPGPRRPVARSRCARTAPAPAGILQARQSSGRPPSLVAIRIPACVASTHNGTVAVTLSGGMAHAIDSSAASRRATCSTIRRGPRTAYATNARATPSSHLSASGKRRGTARSAHLARSSAASPPSAVVFRAGRRASLIRWTQLLSLPSARNFCSSPSRSDAGALVCA